MPGAESGVWLRVPGAQFDDPAGIFLIGEGPHPPGIDVFSRTYEGIIPSYPNDSVWVSCFLVFSIL
jgi:hypothetical protein